MSCIENSRAFVVYRLGVRMGSVKRWAGNIFVLLCLLVFVGSVMLWVRSYFVGEEVYYQMRRAEGANGEWRTQYIAVAVSSWRGKVAVFREARVFAGSILYP